MSPNPIGLDVPCHPKLEYKTLTWALTASRKSGWSLRTWFNTPLTIGRQFVSIRISTMPCLEVNKGWCTATRTRWHRLDHSDHSLHTPSHVQPKKAFEAVDHQSWIEWYIGCACGSYVDGQWHEGAPLLSQSTPPNSHSSECLYTSLYSSHKGQIHRWSRICHVLSWCDLPRIWGSIAVDRWWEIARRMQKSASSAI